MSMAEELGFDNEYLFQEIEKQINFYNQKKSSSDTDKIEECFTHLHNARRCIMIITEREGISPQHPRLVKIVEILDELEAEPEAIASEKLYRQNHPKLYK